MKMPKLVKLERTSACDTYMTEDGLFQVDVWLASEPRIHICMNSNIANDDEDFITDPFEFGRGAESLKEAREWLKAFYSKLEDKVPYVALVDSVTGRKIRGPHRPKKGR